MELRCLALGLFVFLLAPLALGHVCNDVVGGGQAGCPDPQTVKYVGNSVSVNRFTIVSDITAKHIEWVPRCTGDEGDGCYDNADYGNCNSGSDFTTGFTVQSFNYNVNTGDNADLSFSSSPATSYSLNDGETQRFNIYIDVDASAPSQHFEIDIGMKGSLSGTIRPIYTLSFDWVAEGCSGPGDCSGSTPFCDVGSGVCVACLVPADCDDGNACTTDSCSGGSCNTVDVVDGASCSGGFCCSGVCDTSTGNAGFAVACRSGPSCVGGSWEYSVANTGSLCADDCTVCSAGYCDTYDDNQCEVGESCSLGTCVSSGCSGPGDCSGSTPFCDVGSGVCVACLVPADCDDGNACTTDSCVGGVCSSSDVTDEIACTGGTCCDGTCDTTLGNADYDEACRTGPRCNFASWEYEVANQGALCSGDCMTCSYGRCDEPSNDFCGGGEYCSEGTCEPGIGCDSNDDCGGDTPYCLINSNYCVECSTSNHCDDGNECTTDLCIANSCTFDAVSDGASCSGGYCCAGGCDTSTGNTGLAAACRSGPSCVGGSWEYSIANTGEVCSGICTTCDAGMCDVDDDGLCSAGETCSAGTCISSGCSVDGDCDDSNPCTTDTCSGGTCSNDEVIDGTTCGGGYCCSGGCDTSTGNTGLDEDCRAAPACDGSNWEYSAANDGELCDGTCTVCNNGYCDIDDNDLCEDGESCSVGECVVGCVDGCEEDGEQRCSQNGMQVCGNHDSDECLEWSTSQACPDNQCYEAICSDGMCDEVLVAAGRTDEACTGNEGCIGGDCSCDGNGTCVSGVSGETACTPSWECGEWGVCVAGQQTRTCTDNNNCQTTADRPDMTADCTSENPTPQSGTGDRNASGGVVSTDTEEGDTVTGSSGSGNAWWVLILIACILGGGGFFAYKKFFTHKPYQSSSASTASPTMQTPALLNTHPEVDAYIESSLEKNIPPDTIRQKLISAGWEQELIDQKLAKVKK